ncbi:hypothetical protein KP509_17G033700 [Ceratopteris richardii]|nr:hypothetical protein KP509_17G033700 [Ceratopteris richardii]
MNSYSNPDGRHSSWCRSDAANRKPSLREELLGESVTFSYGVRSSSRHDIAAFIMLLRDCTRRKDFYGGCKLHEAIESKGLLEECSDDLVVFYAKCGKLVHAKELLYSYNCKSVFPWNAVIAAYARQGQGGKALECFMQMQHKGPSPNSATFTGVIKACGSLKAINKGREFHDEIVRQGFLEDDIVLGNALVDMYVKCGLLLKAHRVLEELPFRDCISWNTLIAGYAQDGQGEKALDSFEQMQNEGILPDRVTFTCILKVCAMLGARERGECIHDIIYRQGMLQGDVMLGTALIDMYAKCGALMKAKKVLEELSSRDIVAWNALMVGYAQNGQGEEALKCYERMQAEGLSANAFTFSCILKACGATGDVKKGERIHHEISRRGLLANNVVVGNSLVGMYVKCNALDKAWQALQELPSKNVVTWNTYLAGLIQNDQCEQVLASFESMKCQGFVPDQVTFVCVLKACGILGAADIGKKIYDDISRQGLLVDDIILSTAVVDMFAKCGCLGKAAQALQELAFRDTVTWNALIAGYAQQGLCEKVLECLRWMQIEGISPDASTFVCVLNACSHSGLLEDGFMFFKDMSTKYGIRQNLEHFTCMIDLFGRLGHLDKAVEMIQEIPSDDSAVWSVLLDACGKWGDVDVGRWALQQAALAEETNSATYVLLSNVHANTGLVNSDVIDVMGMEILWDPDLQPIGAPA